MKDHFSKKYENLQILSKHNSWITISPITNNRVLPFEKSTLDIEKHAQILPKWMNLNSYKNRNLKNDKFKSVEYYPYLNKSKKMMMLVDKNLNPKLNKSGLGHRSIFSFQDFGHNVVFEDERKYFDNLVNKEPRKFFDWEDRKVSNAKTKRDI